MSLTQALIEELTQEAAATRRLLERVPEDKVSWKPHPKSMSLGQLALHVAIVPRGIAQLLTEPVTELPTVPRPEATSVAELLSALDDSIAFATAKLSSWGDAGLETVWKMTRKGETLLEMPRIGMVRALMFSHVFHHRGQLTVYLRLLDVPLPPVYGATADETPFA